MSSSIVIALPKIEDAKKIRTILNRHGLTVASVCSSVSNALASISELDSGVLICGYKLTDAYYKDALDNLPQYFEMLLLASQRIIDEAPNSVSTVQMPMKASALIDTVNDMLYHLERRIKKEKKKPKPRSEKEQNYISNAKRLLMEKNQMTEEEASTWDVFLNDKFKRQVTIKDNVRDSYFAALGSYRKDELMDESLRNAPDYQERLMQIMNDVDSDTIENVEDILQDMQGNVYSFETDSGKADMISGKVVANYQWSGDAVYAMDQAEEDDFYLDFAVPEESTNLWFDGWVMLKSGIGQDAEKQQAAEAFVNFVSRPDNAVRNMYYIGYTSVISGGDDDTVYDYLKWNYEAEDDEEDTTEYPVGFFFCGDDSNEDYIMTVPEEQTRRQLFAQYPTQEVLQRSAVMQYFDDTANKEINQMWINVRCYNIEDVPVQIWIFVGVAIVLVIYITIRIRMSHYREKK